MNSKRVRWTAILCFAAMLAPIVVAQDNSGRPDNPSVYAQLNAVKPIVARIKRDAVEMQSYTVGTGLSAQTHANKLSMMKKDVNDLQDYMRGLQSHRTVASPWQQEAIDRVTSLANDLATNMNTTISHLNNSKGKPLTSPYPEYLKANTQIVTELSDEITDIIDYGQTRDKEAALEKKLPQ